MIPRFVAHLSVLENISNLVYKTDLPQKMASVYNVFHVSYLWNFVHDSDVIVVSDQLNDIEVEPEASRPRSSIRIIKQSTRQLRKKMVKLAKV